MDTLEVINSTFHDLGGPTNSQYMHNFNTFVKDIENLNMEAQKTVILQLKPENRLQELLFTKLVLKFSCKEMALDILLQGDRILGHLITKHRPFILEDVNKEYLLETIFPNISMVLRNRIIHVFSQSITDDSRGEELFNTINEKYGVSAAAPLVTSCSESFVRDVFVRYNVDLKQRQLIRLCQRFSGGLLVFYYTERKKYGLGNLFSDHEAVAQYLVINDIQSYFALLKFGVPNVGKKGYLNFIKHYKNEIIADPKKYCDTKSKKQTLLFRLLSDDEILTFLMNLLPTNFDSMKITYALNDFTKYVAPHKRCKIVSTAFQKKYSYNIWDHDDYFITSFINFLPLEDRKTFKQEKDKDENLPPAEAFPKIKQQISLTVNKYSRAQLIRKLFTCAELHKDANALEEALMYVCKRHKNDDSSIRQDVFDTVRERWSIKALNANCWKYIKEIRLTEQLLNENSYFLSGLLETELEYLLHNSFDLEAALKDYIKHNGMYIKLPSYSNNALNKACLPLYPKIINELWTEAKDLEEARSTFLNLLYHWNNDHPKEFISYYNYPECIDACLNHGKENARFSEAISRGVIRFIPDDPKGKEKHEAIINNFEIFKGNEEVMFFYLKYRPEIIAKNLNALFHDKVNMSTRFYYAMMKMFYNPDIMKINEIALENLQSEDHCIVEKSLRILSFRKDFLQIIGDKFFPPPDAVIDLYEENIKAKVKIQETLLRCFRSAARPSEVLEPLLKFCYKDYFQKAMPTVWFIFFNTPLKYIKEPLNELLLRSVTIRKRAIYLVSCLETTDYICNFLRKVGETEKNESLQKFIVFRSFNVFCNNSNNETFDLLMEHLKLVPPNDSETLAMLYNLKKIPRVFVGLYVEKLWDNFGKNMKRKATFLKILDKNVMPLLSDRFCDQFLCFLNDPCKEVDCVILDFVYKYLMFSGNQMDRRFELLVEATSLGTIEEDFVKKNKKLQKIINLFLDLSWKLVEDEEGSKDLKLSLLDKVVSLKDIIKLPYNSFEYYILLEILRGFLKEDGDLPSFIINQKKELLSQYGDLLFPYVINLLKGTLNRLINSLEVNHIDFKLNFIQKMLQSDSSESTLILAIALFPTEYPVSENHRNKVKELIALIEQSTSSSVIVYLNNYLKEVDF